MFYPIRANRRSTKNRVVASSNYARQSDNVELLAFIVLICLIPFVLNEAALSTIQGVGFVYDKEHYPAHNGQTSTGAMYRIPDQYILSVSFDQIQKNIAVDWSTYEKTKLNGNFYVTYTKGRLFSNVNIISYHF